MEYCEAQVAKVNAAERAYEFEMKQCPVCQVHAVVPEGQVWEHACFHQMVWKTVYRAECVDCDWSFDRPRGMLGEAVREAHREHTRQHTASEAERLTPR